LAALYLLDGSIVESVSSVAYSVSSFFDLIAFESGGWKNASSIVEFSLDKISLATNGNLSILKLNYLKALFSS
jgi:hypothetical protein